MNLVPMRTTVSSILASAFLALALASCGAATDDPKGPFGSQTPNTVATFNAVSIDGAVPAQIVTRDETVTVNGRTFTRFKLTRTGAASETFSVFVNWEPDTVEFGGGELFWNGNPQATPGVPFVSGTPDSPIVADLDPPTGEDQTLEVKGTVFMPDPSTPIAVDTVGTYRAVAKNQTVQTSMGPVAGCTEFTGEVTFQGTTVNAHAFYHPDLGMVKGSLDWPPPNGVSLDMVDLTDMGSGLPGFNTLRRMKVVDAADTTFEINTYDVNNDFDADKNTHAKMLLEMRYVDETLARDSSLQPKVSTDFGTTFGYFPHMVMPSPVSFFHPEENGQGFTYWVAYVDQASKNSMGETEAYHISATWSASESWPVRVTGRIIYKQVDN
ncbi:MAG TPA: hypothetical protein PKK50_02580 [Myxococcota bacterium]|mgnify:FL=1|nr:hypothetical protein [Myxococcota bacterium]